MCVGDSPVGWSGSGTALSPPRPLRTALATFTARGSSRSNALFTGHGFDTFQPRLWTWQWQFRWDIVLAVPSTVGAFASALWGSLWLSTSVSLFGPGVSALRTVQHLSPVLYGRSAERPCDAYRGSLTLTIPRHPGRLNRLVLAVATSAHASVAALTDAGLSQTSISYESAQSRI